MNYKGKNKLSKKGNVITVYNSSAGTKIVKK